MKEGRIVKSNPQRIEGSWVSGIVLDVHTVSSNVTGQDEEGRPTYDTVRTEIGELLYRFKYQNDSEALKKLLPVACEVLVGQKVKFDIVVPVPPSTPYSRYRMVTKRIAEGLADGLGSKFGSNAITKKKSTEQLKQVEDPEKRKELLSDAFSASPHLLSGKTILLVDDLYRSGATLENATEIAYKQGKAKDVYVFAVTRTRVRR